MGGDYQDDGTGYPPDGYMNSSDGQYPDEYPEDGAFSEGSAAGNPYAMADPYAVEDPYPDGGVSPEGIPYYGSGRYGGQESFPFDGDAQYADRSEYPEESGTAEDAAWQTDESSAEQDSESQPPRFLPESGYIQET